jgi:hypothetical protein
LPPIVIVGFEAPPFDASTVKVDDGTPSGAIFTLPLKMNVPDGNVIVPAPSKTTAPPYVRASSVVVGILFPTVAANNTRDESVPVVPGPEDVLTNLSVPAPEIVSVLSVMVVVPVAES